MDKRPNFLVIMTEQHRGDCLGIDGHPVLQTPNIDSIAGGGVRFTHAYTTSPSCIPARRSFLSGQFPATHSMVGYKEGVEWNAPPTLPEVLGNAGYHTFWVGRSMHQHPIRKRYGFDHMLIGEDYYQWLEENSPGGFPKGEKGWFGSGVMHNDYTVHPWSLPEYLHQTNWTVDRALEFLEKRDPSCPFFLVISFIASHPPLQPPPFYFERYIRTGVPEPFIGDWEKEPPNGGIGLDIGSHSVKLTGEKLLSARAGYYGLINHVDDQIRRILNPVKGITTETKDNTVVIFTSDHGEMLGDHYHWHKVLPYEGSARIPFLIQSPKRFNLNSGTVIDKPICLSDIMPTVCDFAGIDIPDTVEGRSLLLLMKEISTDWRKYLHIEHSPVHHTLTNGKEKYIWFVQDGREQFFDLSKDPTECHDLIDDPKESARISVWRNLLIQELKDRPEGFTDGKKLISGRPYPAVLPHGEVK